MREDLDELKQSIERMDANDYGDTYQLAHRLTDALGSVLNCLRNLASENVDLRQRIEKLERLP